MAKTKSKPGTAKTAAKKKAGSQNIKAKSKVSPARGKGKPQSKQEDVLARLRQPQGTTIGAIVKATGWQPHSVRGFFAGVVKKKLKLTLTSDKVDGTRIYKIGKAGAAS